MTDGYYWYRPTGDTKWYPIEVEDGRHVTWFGSDFPGAVENLSGDLIPLPSPDDVENQEQISIVKGKSVL